MSFTNFDNFVPISTCTTVHTLLHGIYWHSGAFDVTRVHGTRVDIGSPSLLHSVLPQSSDLM